MGELGGIMELVGIGELGGIGEMGIGIGRNWELGIGNLGMEFGIGRTHPAHAFTGRELRVEV